jgi:tRNA pseudouridine55 synthase
MTLRVSGGTYIRTLCADIGAALGCGGVMATLRRTEAGGFPIADCVTLDELESMEPADRMTLLRPVEALFADHPALNLPDFYRGLCRNGCEIYLKKLGATFPIGTRLRICDICGTFFALGEVMEYADGPAVKAIKIFVL